MASEIATRIASSTGISEDEVMRMIKEKQDELSGLISEEGASHLVAKELGVQLVKKTVMINIGSIVPGMQNVDAVGRVVRIMPAREFKTEKASGKVQNIIIGDATGTVRLSLWNDEIEKYKVTEGAAVRVRGFVKEDNLGNPEIRIGRFGMMAETDEPVPEVKEAPARKTERSSIAGLKEGGYKEVRGALLQVFESNPFYEVCSVCGTRIKETKCADHDAEIDYGMVVSGIADDGTGSIRIVLFGDTAGKLLGMTKNEAKQAFEREKNISAIYKNISLGEEYVFEGKARRNEFFDRLELIVNNVKSVDIKKEIETLLS